MTLLQAGLSAIGILGGTGGIAALGSVVVQRRKFRADAADVLTGTALTLVKELEAEAVSARQELASARRECAELRQVVAALTATMTRWKYTVMDPYVSVEQLRTMVQDPTSTRGEATGK